MQISNDSKDRQILLVRIALLHVLIQFLYLDPENNDLIQGYKSIRNIYS